MFHKLGELWREHTGPMIGAIAAVVGALLVAGTSVGLALFDNDPDPNPPSTEASSSTDPPVDAPEPTTTDAPERTTTTDAPDPTTTDAPERTTTTDAPDPTTISAPEIRATENPIDYVALVRSGETFQVTFFGSEACEDEGELGAIQRGETYDLTWNGGGGGFVAHGPSQNIEACARYAPSDIWRVTNLADADVRLNIWGLNDLRFEPDTGLVTLWSDRSTRVGQIERDQ